MLKVLINNPHTTITGILTILASFGVAFGDTSTLFGALSREDFTTVGVTWPTFIAHWGLALGLLSSGVSSLFAKDAGKPA